MDDLTPRQRDVVARLSRGLANKQIAAELGISERAVKGHVSDLLRKYGVPSRAGVIAYVLMTDPQRLSARLLHRH